MPTCYWTGEAVVYRDGDWWHTVGNATVCRSINEEEAVQVGTREYQETSCDSCPESSPTVVRRPTGTRGLPDGWTLSYQGPEVDEQAPPSGAWLEHCPRCSERVADARRRREAPGRKPKTEQPVLVTA